MTIRVYIMPAILTSSNCWHPKYMFRVDPEMRLLMKARFHCKRFGAVDNPLRIVFVDTTPANHTILRGYPDVVNFPANLNNTVGVNLEIARTQLRDLGLPAKKLQATHTWKQLIKRLINHSESLKLLHKDNIKEFVANNLTTLIIDLPANVQTKINTFLTNRGISVDLTGLDVEDLLEELTNKININHVIDGVTY